MFQLPIGTCQSTPKDSLQQKTATIFVAHESALGLLIFAHVTSVGIKKQLEAGQLGLLRPISQQAYHMVSKHNGLGAASFQHGMSKESPRNPSPFMTWPWKAASVTAVTLHWSKQSLAHPD